MLNFRGGEEEEEEKMGGVDGRTECNVRVSGGGEMPAGVGGARVDSAVFYHVVQV